MDLLLDGMLVLVVIAAIVGAVMLYRRPSPDGEEQRWHVFYTFTYAADGSPVPFYDVGLRAGVDVTLIPMRLQAISWRRVSVIGFASREEARQRAAQVQREHREAIAKSCAHPGPKSFVPAHRKCDSET